jgi:CubicO group peptidase (beta-lactamase class C family)
LIALLLFAACSGPQVEQLDERIANFEASVQPAVVFQGEPTPEWSLADRMTHHKVPGLSVAVILDGEIAWARGYGMADVEAGRPVTADTLFQAASISKPVAAMAALRMIQDGAIGLEQDVNEKLTSWSIPEHDWPATSPVTLRGVLSHSAGTTVHGFPGYARDATLPTVVGVLNGEGNTEAVVVDVEPGTIYRYSGGGYTLMQQLLVDLTGQEFPEIMAGTVLGPLGMESSTYEQPLPEARWSEAATAYRGDGSAVAGDWHVYAEMAAAGLWTTPTDLATFALSIQQARAGGSHPVLKPEWIEAMLTPVLADQALGPGVGEETFGHGGANEGFRCNLIAAKDGSWGLAVMTNSDNGESLGREVLLTLAREYGWEGHEPREVRLTELTSEQLQVYAGGYEIQGFGVVQLSVEGDRLSGVLPDESTFVLRPESELLFIDPEDGQTVTFEFDGDVVAALTVPGARAVKIE